MPLNLCPAPSARAVAALASAVLLVLLTTDASLRAQTSSQFQGPVCVAPPTLPGNDTWPVAVADSLGTIAAPRSVAFTGTMLLSNDHATTAVTLVRVGSTSTNAGSISGATPYVYSPPPRFAGTDSFEYEIRDATGETTTGVVTVDVIDATAPTVRITAPAAGTVSGIVTMSASASDNVGVVGVRFFDGTIQIGAEDLKTSYSVSWDSRLVLNGTHKLTAVARDAAGNTATSAAVAVTVSNIVTTALHDATVPAARRLAGIN